MLTILRNGINYKVYPSSADFKIKDFILVKIIKMNKTFNNKLDLNNYCFKAIYFYKVKILDFNNLPVI